MAALAVLLAVVVSGGHPYTWFSAFAVVPLAVGIVLRSWYWPLASSVILVVLTAILIVVVLAPLVLDRPNADPDVVLMAIIFAVEGAVAAVLAAAGALIGTFVGRRWLARAPSRAHEPAPITQ